MSEATPQPGEPLVALAEALARAERAEGEVRERDGRLQALEGERDTYRPQRVLLQAITERVLAALLVIDGEEFRAKWANPAGRRMLDEPYRTQVDITGLRLEEFLPGAANSGLLEMLRQVADTGQAQFDPETEYSGFERGVTYWRWSIVPLPGASATRPDLLLVANELTEQVLSRRQVEAANARLRDSQARLAAELADAQMLQSISTQLIQNGSTHTLYGQILDAAIALLRSDMGSLQTFDPDRDALQLLTWEGLAPAAAAFWQWVRVGSSSASGMALARGARVSVPDIETCAFMAGTEDLAHYRLSGIRAVQATPLVSRGGRVVGMICNHWREPHELSEREARLLDVLARQAADLVERARAESQKEAALAAVQQTRDSLDRRVQERTAELAAANGALQYQATLLANINDAVVATDSDYQITAFNHAAEQLYGLPAAEVLGRPVVEVLRPEFIGPSGDQAREDLIARGQWQGEVMVHCRDCSAVYCDVRAMVLRDAGGQITGYVATYRDISERKQAEAQREAALAALRASREELRAYSRRLVDAIENERRSLARELHDQAGQSMAAVKLSLGNLRRRVDVNGEHAARFDEIEQLIEGVLDDLHRLAVNLRPASLDRFGLLPALEQYVAFYRQQTGLTVDLVTVGIKDRRLPAEMETAVYRVIQEALTNIVRHAAAHRVGLMLQRDEKRVLAIIEDDGQGFDVTEAMHCGRLGLLGMRERAEIFGGSLTIESAAGKGTTVYIALPFTG